MLLGNTINSISLAWLSKTLQDACDSDEEGAAAANIKFTLGLELVLESLAILVAAQPLTKMSVSEQVHKDIIDVFIGHLYL